MKAHSQLITVLRRQLSIVPQLGAGVEVAMIAPPHRCLVLVVLCRTCVSSKPCTLSRSIYSSAESMQPIMLQAANCSLDRPRTVLTTIDTNSTASS